MADLLRPLTPPYVPFGIRRFSSISHIASTLLLFIFYQPKSREKLLTIKGNTHDGYDVIFKDGRTVHCRTKLEIRRCLAHDNKSLAQDT